jgi:UDP-N-acetylglucosamine 2-epimerase
MEDYTGAYQARKNDITALLTLPSNHQIAIFHLGGIAIECRLKAFLLTYHRIKNWNEKSRRTKDAMFNQEIHNPNHSLLTAIKHMPELYQKAKSNRELMEHLAHIIYPLGASAITYIDIRYHSEPEALEYDWKKSFDYVSGWLEKNKETIL